MSAFLSLFSWGAVAYDAVIVAVGLFILVGCAVMLLSGSISEEEDRYDE